MATETSKVKKIKKAPGKYQHSNAHNLNTYNKKLLLSILTENGCDKSSYEDIRARLRKSKPGAIEEYINAMAENSQKNVPEECNLQLFKSMNVWAEYFKEAAFTEDCNYEIPLMLKSIAHLEKHPSPSQAGGVNFCQLYNFLANVSRGDPSPPLDKPTGDFLKETFEELLTAVGSCDGISDKAKLKSAIVENANVVTIVEGNDEFPPALDQLNVEV